MVDPVPGQHGNQKSMKNVILKRIEKTEECSIGILSVDGMVVCLTLEEPWRNNQQDISCIPPGNYPLKLEFSPSRQRNLWTIKDVPKRTYVRVHTGNTVDDTEGCPLTGTYTGEIKGKRAVMDSRAAFKRFMAAMGDETEAKITIQ